MKEEGFREIVENGNFEWPWQVDRGLMIISGASGGGGGGGGGTVGEKAESSDWIVADGGDGGTGFPGETVIFPLHDLSTGESFGITIGRGGGSGMGGEGFVPGKDGSIGNDGSVYFVPLFD